jgi:hypothetical protein
MSSSFNHEDITVRHLRYAGTARANCVQAIGSCMLDAAAGQHQMVAARANGALAGAICSPENGKHSWQA